ncbi:MFS transporter [Puia sp. P3]|uniref:MFS transporter n=1 Tax=Puia sp. P3 TaxID=3423952 RepID=UPI003D671185
MFSRDKLFNRAGIPGQLVWGYLGILIFMMGDGVEQGWLSPYLIGRGLAIEQSAMLFTVYGVTIAIASWFSGVLTDSYGPRKTMLAGILLYIAGTAGFVGLGLPGVNFPVMLATYAVRGFGYPLFAYSFLVWIMYRSPKNRLSTAAGWFWFVFTGGLNVFGAYYSSWAIQRLGYLDTLWTSIFWVALGAFFALGLNRDRWVGSAGGSGKLNELKKALRSCGGSLGCCFAGSCGSSIRPHNLRSWYSCRSIWKSMASGRAAGCRSGGRSLRRISSVT